jgi:hypothetical protein
VHKTQTKKVMWHEVIFFNFLELFFNGKDMLHKVGDMACLLNFQKCFSIEKDDKTMWHTYMLRELKLITCSGS